MTNQKALTTPQQIDNKLDEIRAFLNSQSEQKTLDQTPTPKVRSIEILYETKTLKNKKFHCWKQLQSDEKLVWFCYDKIKWKKEKQL